MKLTINREQLLKGLNVISKSINDKHPIPIMRNVKLELNHEGLGLIGTDNELTIKTVIPFMIGSTEVIRNYQPGATLVSFKILFEITRRLDGNEITLEVIDETIVEINDGRSNFRLNSIKPEEYPDIDLDPTGVTFNLAGKKLAEIVDQTAFAASQKEQRPILTAVNFSTEGNKLVVVATDSARLAHKEATIDDEVKFNANIPAKVISEISRLCLDEEKVTISISETKILFAFNGTVVNSRLIAGEYPSTKNIIPRSYNYFLEVNSEELLKAMDRVALLSSSDRENVVKLTMSETDGVQISTKSAQNGSATEQLETFHFTGERLEISFNAAFVASAVRACKSQDVMLGFLGEMKPFSVRNDKDDSQIQIVTPVRTY